MISMENEIRAAVEAFVRAGDTQDRTLLEEAAHPQFRVVAPNYPEPGSLAVLSRSDFGSLLESRKIGGDQREVQILSSDKISDSGAVVRARLTGRQMVFENSFTVVLSEGKWKLIQDLAQASARRD